MDDNKDIRWKQRFHNFSRAYALLRSAIEDRSVSELSELEQEGVIQRFEYTFELGWKVLKDYLEYSGILLKEATARKVIKECAAANIFSGAGINPGIYLDMMLARNTLSHNYDFEHFKKVIEKIKESYLSELEKEYMYFLDKVIENDENA